MLERKRSRNLSATLHFPARTKGLRLQGRQQKRHLCRYLMNCFAGWISRIQLKKHPGCLAIVLHLRKQSVFTKIAYMQFWSSYEQKFINVSGADYNHNTKQNNKSQVDFLWVWLRKKFSGFNGFSSAGNKEPILNYVSSHTAFHKSSRVGGLYIDDPYV